MDNVQADIAQGAGTARDYGYYRRALTGQALPLAFVDVGALTANLHALVARAGNLPIRLVTKSVRSVGIMRLLLAASPAVRGLLCYSAREAAWLAGQGFNDLVVAYPTVEPADVEAVAAALRQGALITLMVDSVGQLEVLAAIALREGVVLPVAIDLDMSSDFPGLHFGVYRSPVDGPAAALALAGEIRRQPALRLEGLMGYESQIAGVQDRVPGSGARGRLIRWLKSRSVAEVNRRRTDTVRALAAAGHPLRFVNGGGTGSFETTRLDPVVTELAAGSGLYAPTLFDHYSNFHAEPAAGFALSVSRVPRAGMVTCAGGGYPASGPGGADRSPKPWLPEGCSLVALEGAGEVQTPVRLPAGATLELGDPLLFRHAKAGELCERFTELVLIEGGAVTGRTTTYRGDGQCFF